MVLVIFLFFMNLFAFAFGQLFERGQADLEPFFNFVPWLFLFLIPAISMRLWSEERRNGSIELLLTQPVTLWQAVLGKFLAAWVFVGIALALTFPIWVTINYLGNPDNGTIFAAYVGCFIMAGGFLGIGSFTSSLTKNQLIAFLIAALICFLLLMAGFPAITDWFRARTPEWFVDGVASLSFLTHYENIMRGVLDLRDILYFALVTTFFLLASTVVLDARKSE